MLDITLAGAVGENLEPDGARDCWTKRLLPFRQKAGERMGHPQLGFTPKGWAILHCRAWTGCPLVSEQKCRVGAQPR
jgi:hypothetical protein